MNAPQRKLRVLILEDQPDDAELAAAALAGYGIDCEWQRVDDEAAYRRALDQLPDLVLADHALPTFNGGRALRLLNERGLDIPYIAVSGELDSRAVLQLMRDGARDFVSKRDLAMLGPAVARELRSATERREQRRAGAVLEQLKLAVESSDDSIAVFDRELRYVYANPAHQRRHGVALDAFVGRSLRELIGDAAFMAVQGKLERCLAGETVRFETELEFRAAGRRYVQVQYSPLRDETARIVGVVGVLRDMSEQRAAELALRDSEAHHRMLFESSPQPMWVFDRETLRFLAVNQAACQGYGWSRDEFLAMTIMDLRPTEAERARLAESLRRSPPGLDHAGHWRHKRRDGSVIDVEITAHRIDFAGRTAELVLATDVTERLRAERRLAYLASHDNLTGLPNRNAIHERLTAELGAAGDACRLALLVVNLDRFKEINDTLGHGIGDAALAAASERLQALAPAGGLVARLGGDEFALLAPGADRADAEALAEAVMDAFAQPLQAAEHELFVTASTGVALHPAHGASADDVLRNADLAMYRAKKDHAGGFLFYDPRFTARLRNLRQLEHELHGALERGELSLRYQPLVALADRRTIGAEALLRWTHPTLGDVSPARFIPVAEETGLIVSIGAWVLRTACAQAAAWRRAGHAELRIAVNVSAHQLRHGGFADLVADALRETGLPARSLELELTESTLMQDSAATTATLQELKALGVSLAMDDFGTGYSSLAYLRRFPIDKLKVDRSFVAELPDDPEAVALAGTIIAMAHGLGLEALAEGVETEAQARFMRDLGCEEAQGWLFAKPMTAEELTERLQRAQAA